MKLFKKLGKGQKGFTLIELLVVIAILGILAAVAIPNIAKFIGEGEDEAQATELANLQTAVIAGMYDGGLTTANAGTVGPGTTTYDLGGGTDLADYVLTALEDLSRTYAIASTGAVSVP